MSHTRADIQTEVCEIVLINQLVNFTILLLFPLFPLPIVPLPVSPLPLTLSTPPLFLLRGGQASHEYQPDMAYQVEGWTR